MGFDDDIEDNDIDERNTEYWETSIEDDIIETESEYWENPLEPDTVNTKISNLSYSERFNFWMSILDNNAALADLYSHILYTPTTSTKTLSTQEIKELFENKKFKILKIEGIEINGIKIDDIEFNDTKRNFFLFKPKNKLEDKIHIKNKKVEYGKVCFTLTVGRYTVGMDIPEGRYKFTAKENYGNVSTNTNTIDEYMEVDDKIWGRLYIGDILIITDILVLELSSKKANLLQNIIRRPIGKEIILKAGNYICGDDFKSGVYDIKRIKNSGQLLFNDDNEYFGGNSYELKEIKNYLFKNNDFLGISGGLIIKLVPSQNNYIK